MNCKKKTQQLKLYLEVAIDTYSKRMNTETVVVSVNCCKIRKRWGDSTTKERFYSNLELCQLPLVVKKCPER